MGDVKFNMRTVVEEVTCAACEGHGCGYTENCVACPCCWGTGRIRKVQTFIPKTSTRIRPLVACPMCHGSCASCVMCNGEGLGVWDIHYVSLIPLRHSRLSVAEILQGTVSNSEHQGFNL